MDKEEIIYQIHNLGCEFDIMTYLIQWYKKELDETKHNHKESKARIKAIRKINKGKNEAIDALCDDDS